MKKRLLFLSLIACTLGSNAIAQQDRSITHFMYDKMSINPGVTGMNLLNGICGTSIYRNQWDGVNGAPNTAILNAEANLSQYSKFLSGVGISFYHDAIAYTRQNTAVINYSLPVTVGDVGILGVGIGLGITNMGMNPSWIPPTNAPDVTLPGAFSATKLDMNFGLYFKGNEGYYIGLSSTHLPAGEFEGESQLSPTALVGFNSARHYYLMGGHTLTGVGGVNNDLEFNALVKTDVVKTSFDINARYMWEKQLYGGLTYRMSDAIGIMVGANVFHLINGGEDNTRWPSLTVGYSYDISVNKLSSVSRGSHEMMVKYCMFLPPIPLQVSHHPRWL